MAVFCRSGTESEESIINRAIYNSPEKGRKPVGEYRQILDDMTHQIAIDRIHIVKLNEKSYEAYKDFYWFVKCGRVTSIRSVKKIDSAPWFEFEYQYLDELIFRDKLAKTRNEVYELTGANIIRANGDAFDLRFSNLSGVAQGGIAGHVGFSPLAPIPRVRPFQEEDQQVDEQEGEADIEPPGGGSMRLR